jgi:anti-sigma factor RsiW
VKEHYQIQTDVLAWIEGTLDANRRSVIARHLEECAGCRRYFETVSAALEPRAAKAEPLLAADPYLPVRVRAIAAGQGGRESSRHEVTLRWTWRTAALVVAMLLGIFIGESLSYRTPQITDHHIVYEYSNSFGDSGIESRWQTISLAAGEEMR